MWVDELDRMGPQSSAPDDDLGDRAAEHTPQLPEKSDSVKRRIVPQNGREIDIEDGGINGKRAEASDVRHRVEERQAAASLGHGASPVLALYIDTQDVRTREPEQRTGATAAHPDLQHVLLLPNNLGNRALELGESASAVDLDGALFPLEQLAAVLVAMPGL
jgi:hypothetical protein